MCFNPSPERRVPSPNRYMAFARFCFCKNNKRTIIICPNGSCFFARQTGIKSGCQGKNDEEDFTKQKAELYADSQFAKLSNEVLPAAANVFKPEPSSNRAQRCRKCTPALEYVLNSSLDRCQECPRAGLICHGDQTLQPVTINSSWVREGPIFRLQSVTCWSCAPGYYKASVSTEPCAACPPSTYREMPGATELGSCVPCHANPLPMAEGKAASRLVSVNESTIASHRATPTASRRSHAKPVREARCAEMARSVPSETQASTAQTRAASRAAGACKAAVTMSSFRVTLATRCAPQQKRARQTCR
jgi:hypothetical protein